MIKCKIGTTNEKSFMYYISMNIKWFGKRYIMTE